MIYTSCYIVINVSTGRIGDVVYLDKSSIPNVLVNASSNFPEGTNTFLSGRFEVKELKLALAFGHPDAKVSAECVPNFLAAEIMDE